MAAPAAMPTGPPTAPRAAPASGTAAGTHTGRQVVVCEVIAVLGVHDLTGTFAGKTSSHGAHRCAGRHAHRPTDGAERCTGCSTAARTDTFGEVVIGQIVLTARIDHLARTFAREPAGYRAHCGAGSHADRAAHGTQRCSCRSATARADTLGQVVISELIAALGIGHLARSLACEAAGDGANRGACSHAQRSANGSKRRAGGSAPAGADTLGQVVIREVIAALGIDDLGSALASETTGHAADGSAGRHADRTGNGADAGAGDGARCRTGARAEHVLTLVLLPAALEVTSVFLRARRDAHQDAALLDAFFVVLDPLLGDAGADQGADQPAGHTTSAGTGKTRGRGASDDEPETRQDERRTDRGNGGERCADGAADPRADARTLGGLAAQFRFGSASSQKVTLARLVAHDQVHVILAIAPGRDVAVRTLDAVAVVEETGDHPRARRLIHCHGDVLVCCLDERDVVKSRTCGPTPALRLVTANPTVVSKTAARR